MEREGGEKITEITERGRKKQKERERREGGRERLKMFCLV